MAIYLPKGEVRTTQLKAKTIRSVMDNLINPQNASFLLQLYDEYLRDENSVDPQWKSFFYLAWRYVIRSGH